VLEYNNRLSVTVRFCGFGADLDAGAGVRFHGTRVAQVRFCRYGFSPTGELGYSGIRGAEG
jgi:hypothetical protein